MAATAPWQEERRLTRIPSRKDLRDKSTLISIFPKAIHEEKITIMPAHYHLEPGSLAKPSVLVVGAASWWKDIPESGQIVEVNENSKDLCEAIIRDYSQGLLAYTPAACPGLFYIDEEVTAVDALKKYPQKFAEADEKQKAWFLALVNLADAIWATTPNPRAIGSDMRMAAKELGMDTKAWLSNYIQASMSKCPACGAPRDTNYPVCGTCNMIVDPEKFKALGIQKPEK